MVVVIGDEHYIKLPEDLSCYLKYRMTKVYHSFGLFLFSISFFTHLV